MAHLGWSGDDWAICFWRLFESHEKLASQISGNDLTFHLTIRYIKLFHTSTKISEMRRLEEDSMISTTKLKIQKNCHWKPSKRCLKKCKFQGKLCMKSWKMQRLRLLPSGTSRFLSMATYGKSKRLHSQKLTYPLKKGPFPKDMSSSNHQFFSGYVCFREGNL